MKIGIDAKWFYTGNISGRLFIQNVLPELFSLYPEVEWHIFLNKKDKRDDNFFKQENIYTHYIWSGVNMLSNLFVIPRFARRLNLDAVLFQTFAPKSNAYKSVVFIHDILTRSHPQYFSWKEKLYLFTLKWTVPLANKVITTTEYVKKELLKRKYAGDDDFVGIAPSGISTCFRPLTKQDPAFLQQLKEKYRLPASYLLYVGRINKRKNIEGLLAALPLLTNQEIPLVIVGEADSQKPELSGHLSDNKIKNRVLFTGSVPDEELAAIYAMATVFCFPSFAEGYGLPPLEAMASGVPAIVSNTTSMPEVCGAAATFVNPGDTRNIADNIDRLLADTIYRKQKIAAGLEWSQQFTWQRTARQIMQNILYTLNDSKKFETLKPSIK